MDLPDSIKKEANTFIEESITGKKNSYVSCGDIVKQFVPHLFTKGMTDKINFNTLPKLADLFGELLRDQFEFGTWTQTADDCENCNQKTTETYTACFKGCAVVVDDTVYNTSPTRNAHECKTAPKEIDSAKLEAVLTALHMRLRDLERKFEDGKTNSSLLY